MVRLADIASHPPSNLPMPALVFESDVLEDIPALPMATSVLVQVLVGGETSVHTHPEPELIYQITRGPPLPRWEYVPETWAHQRK